MSHRPRLVVLGRQGSGKGTQCALLARDFGVAHVSTGDLLRGAVRAQTEVGRQVAPIVESGGLVPDDVMVALVAEQALAADWEHEGFVLDGFPRTVGQADAFFDAAGVLDDDAQSSHPAVGLDAAVELDVPRAAVIDRLQRRRVCPVCGTIVTVDDPAMIEVPCPNGHGPAVRRDDDRPEAIERRLALYDSETGPLLPWFDARALLVRVDGTGSPDHVHQRLRAALRDRLDADPPTPT